MGVWGVMPASKKKAEAAQESYRQGELSFLAGSWESFRDPISRSERQVGKGQKSHRIAAHLPAEALCHWPILPLLRPEASIPPGTSQGHSSKDKAQLLGA
jgi:hypothetical protein